MTPELLTRLPLWNDPTPAADAAVAALLDELAADDGRVLHGDIDGGRGRHVMVSSRGVDVVRVVSMAGPLTVGPVEFDPASGRADDGIGLLSGGEDVTDVLRWVDDLVVAMRDSLGADEHGADASTDVRGWLCVLDAVRSPGTDELTVRGHRVVRYGTLARELAPH